MFIIVWFFELAHVILPEATATVNPVSSTEASLKTAGATHSDSLTKK